MKKILIIIMMFLLCACSANKEENTNNETNNTTIESRFIEPLSDDDIFRYLNAETKQLLYKANGDENVETFILKNLGKDLIDGSITTYDGSTIDLSDYKNSKLVIEFVASWCSHCKEQALNYNEELVNALGSDVTLVQYFANGDKSNIDAFYSEVGIDIPSNIIVGINDEEISSKFVSEYNLELTPTFFFFDNGKLTWEITGTLTSDQYSLFKDIAFNGALNIDNLVDDKGNSVLTYIRSEEDVKNDLSEDNYARLESLDNDTYTISYTLKYMGVDADFYNQLSDESNFNSEVTFTDYKNKDLIVVFIDEYDESIISLLNEFSSENNDINLVVLNLSDENNTEIADELKVPLCSIMNQIPQLFNNFDFTNNPTALFIKEGTITGVYSNIESSSKLLEAYNLFLTDYSIALKANN